MLKLYIVIIATFSIVNFNFNALKINASSTDQASKETYIIVKKEFDNRGLVNHLDIYVFKPSYIKAINQILIEKYKTSKIASLQIYYYDDLRTAKIYSNRLFSKNASDKEIKKLGQHLIGKFEYIAFDNSQSLHIGKNADLL